MGCAIGMKVMEDVPYIKGLDRRWLGTEPDRRRVRLPEGLRRGHGLERRGGPVPHRRPDAGGGASRATALIQPEGAQAYVIDDAELERVQCLLPRHVEGLMDAEPQAVLHGLPSPDACRSCDDWTAPHRSEGLARNGPQDGGR